jgi:hypothetical protein
LGLAFIEFLSDAARCREMGKNGKEFVQKRQNIVSETLASLDKIYKVL